jgi:hypothetical protein
MLDLPLSLTVFFIITTILFYVGFLMTTLHGNERTKRRTHMIALLMMAWLIFQSTLALNRWYMDREAIPPHLFFPLITALVFMSLALFTGRGKRFVSGMNPVVLTWLHLVRLPVEIALYWLAYFKQVPWSMTMYGHNFDIIFGITAPIMAYLVFNRKMVSMKIFQIWNALGLVSLLVIVITAIGSLPNFSWWDASRPNYAVTHFPFVWLPAFIVPIVLFSHLAFLLKRTGVRSEE